MLNLSNLALFLIVGTWGISFLVWMHVLDPFLINFSWQAISERRQYWRFFTPVLYGGAHPEVSIFNMLFFTSSITDIDQRCYSSSRKLMMPVIFGLISTHVVARVTYSTELFFLWFNFFLYLQAKQFPDRIMRVLFFHLPNTFLPIVFLFLNKKVGNGVEPMLLQFAAAHVFFFLDEVLPVRFDLSPMLAVEKAIVRALATLRRLADPVGGARQGAEPAQ